MPIKVTCEKCGGVLHAPDDAGGKKGRCPNCQNVLPIPFDGPRAAPGFGGNSGFGGSSSPANPPPGMAFGSSANNPAVPQFPNADAKRPAAPPPFGMGARNEPAGLASSTPGLGSLNSPSASPTSPGAGSSFTRGSVPFGSRPVASASLPIAPEANGWRSAAGGLRWIQVAVFLFLIAIVAPCGVTAFAANGGAALTEKPGFLKWEGVSQFVEIRLASFLIPAVIGSLCILLGRLKVGSVPASSCARGSAKLAAFWTLLAICGFVAMSTIVVVAMKNGFVPSLHPRADLISSHTTATTRVVGYLNDSFIAGNDLQGQIQRLGLLALIVFGKLGEFFFGNALGRIAAAAKNPMAAGRVTRCYFYYAVLGAAAVIGIVVYELMGMDMAHDVWSPKWYGMAQGMRISIVCGVVGGLALVLSIPYLRMLGGVRKACREMGA